MIKIMNNHYCFTMAGRLLHFTLEEIKAQKEETNCQFHLDEETSIFSIVRD